MQGVDMQTKWAYCVTGKSCIAEKNQKVMYIYIYIYRVRQKMYKHFNERKLYVV